LEAPVQRTENLILEKGTRLQSLLDVRVLRDLGQLLIDLCHFLGALPDIAQHFYEEFPRIIYGHFLFPYRTELPNKERSMEVGLEESSLLLYPMAHCAFV
jgi:hypothetical protein